GWCGSRLCRRGSRLLCGRAICSSADLCPGKHRHQQICDVCNCCTEAKNHCGLKGLAREGVERTPAVDGHGNGGCRRREVEDRVQQRWRRIRLAETTTRRNRAAPGPRDRDERCQRGVGDRNEGWARWSRGRERERGD